ncbi:MAG: hypothetical protein LT106_18630 [Burkholderiaceae bacterium]|nr:hypothetical protein [Burkholderiaceae bacterium]
MASADKQLVAAIERAEALADDRALQQERAQALRIYRGDNTNPAEEGRSQYVARDAYDVVETVKPQLLKLFLSGDEVVRFNPVGPEDVEQAKLETEFVNYIALQRNNAFELFDGWIHDGLVQRNGYVLAYWDDAEQVDREDYEHLSDEELALLVQSGGEVVEHELTDEGHRVVIERRRGFPCVRYQNLAPEKVRVSHQHNRVTLADCDFVERIEEKTLAQLRDEGFDVPDDLNDGGEGDADYEQSVREDGSWDDDEGADPSMRRVRVRECWIRTALYSGGKRAELRHVILVGTTILLNEPCDLIPVVGWSPAPLPHQHNGLSMVDEAKDLQDVKTALTRGALDSVYLSLNGRHAIDTERVNLDDMLVSRPGGIVRVQGDPGSAIVPLTSVPTQSIALQAIEYFDQVRESRTGITRYTSGLDPNALNKTATGIMQLQAASMARVELKARRFAEAVKDLFLVTHALTLKHGRRPQMVQLSNQWVAVDPSSWKRRTDMTISVGLGTGNRQEQNMFLMQMLQVALGPGLQLGFSDPSKVHAMLARLTNNAGFKAAEEFWVDPSNAPPRQQPPDPRLMIEQAKLQQAQQETQVDAQQSQAKIAADMQVEQMRMQQAREEAQLRAQTEIERARIDAETKLRIARMSAVQARNQAMVAKFSRVRNARPQQ